MKNQKAILLIISITLLLTSILKQNYHIVRLSQIGGIGILLFTIIGILIIGKIVRYIFNFRVKKDS